MRLSLPWKRGARQPAMAARFFVIGPLSRFVLPVSDHPTIRSGIEFGS